VPLRIWAKYALHNQCTNLVFRISGPKRDEFAGSWRKFHSELHNLYSSPIIIRMIKSRIMRWVGHAWRRRGMHIEFWWESRKERGN
jgi:hypothetical protein